MTYVIQVQLMSSLSEELTIWWLHKLESNFQ